MRSKRPIDIVGLRSEIARLEATQEWPNRSALFQAVASSEWGQSQPQLTASVVYLRVKEFGLLDTLKTAAGRRGGGEALAAAREKGVKRTPRSEKMKAYPATMAFLEAEWSREMPTRVASAQKGSLKALVALKCMDCSCGQRTEIKNCTVIKCPLYPIRPFQGGLEIVEGATGDPHPVETDSEVA